MVSSGRGGCIRTQVLVLEDVVVEEEAFTLTWVYYDKVGVESACRSRTGRWGIGLVIRRESRA